MGKDDGDNGSLREEGGVMLKRIRFAMEMAKVADVPVLLRADELSWVMELLENYSKQLELAREYIEDDAGDIVYQADPVRSLLARATLMQMNIAGQANGKGE